MENPRTIRAFITYAHRNKNKKDDLRECLAVMEEQNELVTWDDDQLSPGDEARQEDILERVADSDMLSTSSLVRALPLKTAKGN